jgi:hypothetical protein
MKARTTLLMTMALAAAIATPVAYAGGPDDRAGARGPGGIAAQQLQAPIRPDDRAVRGTGGIGSAEAAAVSRPDDRSGMRGPGAIDSVQLSQHPDNRAEARGPGAITTVTAPSASSGFDWNDALIGGLAGVGTALLATGCCFLLVSRRNTSRFA